MFEDIPDIQFRVAKNIIKKRLRMRKKEVQDYELLYSQFGMSYLYIYLFQKRNKITML